MKKLLFVFALFLGVQISQAQQVKVQGTISDNQGKPLPGVSVTLKGQKSGIVSASNGTYSISLSSLNGTLVFSSIGFGSKEVSINGKSTINVSLTATDNNLDEVVVVAYGTQRKTTLTGSQTSIKGGEVENKPFTSVDKALQGAVAGLQSSASSGAPGAAQSIRIRGIGSISASAEPLFVIDGLPINTGSGTSLATTSNFLSTLNPNDIEDITVLKDAASSSIYGSRAANGVILVTTKKGKVGATKFRFDAEGGQSNTAYKNPKYQPLNATDFATVTKEGLINAGYATASNVNDVFNSSFTSSLGYTTPVNTNWADVVARTGTQQQYNLSASGGDSKNTFFLSGGYFKQGGTSIASDFERWSGNARIENKATEKLTIGFNINGGVEKQNTPLAGGAFGNPLLNAYFLLPTLSPYKPDGSINFNTSDFNPTNGVSSLYNPIAINNFDKRLLKGLSLRGTTYAEYKIFKDLAFKTQIGFDYTTYEEDQYNNPLYGDGFSRNGRSFSYYTRYVNRDWQNTLEYKRKFLKSQDLSLNLKVGYESQLNKGYFTQVQNSNFPPTTLLNVAAIGATPVTANADGSDYSFVGTFSTANISYQDKYVISGSFRRDGSSRFGSENKYGDFWSIGGSWNIDKEKFFNSLKVLSSLKLRASYGLSGNAGIGNYTALALYGYGSNYINSPGSSPTQPGNPLLTWEVNKPLNVGIDFGMFKNRLNFNIDYYDRKTTQLLLNVPVPLSTGFSTFPGNIGAMQNKGIELAVNAVLVQTKNLQWDARFNISKNTNTITALNNNQDIVSGSFIRRVGYDFQTFYVRQYAGVDPTNGDPLWYLDSTKTTTTNVYSKAQRVLYQSASPKYFGGFGTTLKYKQLSLAVNFYYNFGNYYQDTWGSYYMGAGYGGSFNKVQRIMDRWTSAGQITDVPKYVYGGNKNFQSFSTFFLYKGDYIRLRDVEFGYDLPKSLASRMKLSMLRFYVRGSNLWTWVADNNMPFDPEQGISSQTNLNINIPKTFTTGLNISF